MALLNDNNFEELVPPSLNLFTLPPYQTIITQHYFDEVRPVSQINDSSPLEFQVINAGSDYIDLNRTRLHVKLKVKHADGTNLDVKEPVATVNLFLQSHFSQVSVYLQNQLVSSTNNHYAYKSMMKTLLNYGAEAKNTQLTSQLFYKDIGETNIESTDPLTGLNTGLQSRHIFIDGSKTLTMSGPLYEDIFHMSRHMVHGVNLTVKRSPPQFCLISGKAGQEYKIEILDAYLKVSKLKVNPALILAHNTLFQDSNAFFPYTKSEVKVTSIPSTQLTATIDGLSNPIANRYIVGFVNRSSLNGSYNGNPYNFKSSMLKSISLYINGVSVPGRPTQSDDIESYVNMFDGLCLWRKNTGNAISRSDFLLGSALFVFDIDTVCSESEYLNLLKSGSTWVGD
ncbi:uncharacterized protein F54H12.2-like [Haliotis cracherodii]|uniref:uncharacterized protein F54H12.2-like n=1 Tax=Haliotis cracherodii TaxID=6455 RepID=UPI0039ED0042